MKSPKARCYLEGVSATHWSDCPYTDGSDEFDWWHEGHFDSSVFDEICETLDT